MKFYNFYPQKSFKFGIGFEKNRSQRLKTEFFPQNPQRKTPKNSCKKHNIGILSTKIAQINLYRGITRKFWEKLRVVIHIEITGFGKIEQKIHILQRFIHNFKKLCGVCSTWNRKTVKKFGWMFHMKHFLLRKTPQRKQNLGDFRQKYRYFLKNCKCENSVKIKWYIQLF